MAQPKMGLFELDRIEHGGQPQQRLQFEVEMEPAQRELLALGLGIRHPQADQLEFQRPGLEVDLFHADLAPERRAGLLFQLPLQQRRQGGP